MMKPRVARVLVAVLLLAVPVATSAAVRPWISGALGGSTYAMGDVNDEIGAVNVSLAGTGLKMNEVTKGFNYGLALGLDVGGGFAVGVGYDRLNARTKVGDFSGSLEYDLPANLVRAFGRYTFESPGMTQGFLEASLGRVSSAASITLTVSGSGSATGDIEGSGLAFEAGGGAEIWTAPQFAFTGMAGYRYASAKDVTVDGTAVYDASGGDYTVDYSGLFARVGIKVALAK